MLAVGESSFNPLPRTVLLRYGWQRILALKSEAMKLDIGTTVLMLMLVIALMATIVALQYVLLVRTRELKELKERGKQKKKNTKPVTNPLWSVTR